MTRISSAIHKVVVAQHWVVKFCVIAPAASSHAVTLMKTQLYFFLCRVVHEPTPHPDWISEVCQYLAEQGAVRPADLVLWRVKGAPVKYRRFLRSVVSEALVEVRRSIDRAALQDSAGKSRPAPADS